MSTMNETNNNETNDEKLKWQKTREELLLKTPVCGIYTQHEVSPLGIEGDYITMKAKDWIMVIPEINGKDQFETFNKRDSFLQSVKNWREKFADCLFSNEEIDSLFSSRKDDEDYIRHPEDFV